jgi:hypothetical protein
VTGPTLKVVQEIEEQKKPKKKEAPLIIDDEVIDEGHVNHQSITSQMP